jgi:hypothetical protein
MNPQDTYYRTMNFLMSPVRFVINGIKVLLIGLLLLGVALAWPLLMYMNHEPLTLGTFMVPLLAILLIYTFIRAPWYTVVGGILFLLGICAWALVFNFPDGTETKWLWFAFCAVGLIQWYVRKPIFDEQPKKDAATFLCDSINEDIRNRNQTLLERKTLEYQNMSPGRRETRTTLFGEDFTEWPDL